MPSFYLKTIINMINKYILKPFLIIFLFFLSSSKLYSDNHNVLQILEALQQDIKTLERAVYSNSFESKKISKLSSLCFKSAFAILK